MSLTKQQKGGRARANKLGDEQRSAIATAAARARWVLPEENGRLPKATHKGKLRIGDLEVPCAVLEDGRRVVTETGIATALGSRSGASKRIKTAAANGGAPLPIFLAPSQIKPFISNDILSGPLSPIIYQDGRRKVASYDAEALPAICDVWLRAREAGALQQQQLDRAQKAELLMRGLAHVGIVALVDEATGYQEERDRDELHRMLSAYLSEERLAWAKRFPDEFYRQMYRLMNWPWPVGNQKSPYVGKLTNKLVYDKLPDGVLSELKSRNPISDETKRRKWKHHQFLSIDVGQPDLQAHLLQLIAVMRVSRNWEAFEDNLERAFPGPQGALELD